MNTTKNSIPIVLIHKGYSRYLSYAVKQAICYNKNSPIFLLGNDQTNKFRSVKFINIDSYKDATLQLKKSYKHLSGNDPEMELFCFERWFFLLELMKEYKLKKIFTCDSDVMLYCNVTEEYKLLGEANSGYLIPDHQKNFRLAASAHISFWTYEAMEEFCLFITQLFSQDKMDQDLEDKWNHVVKNNLPGGISDMAFLHLFSRGRNIVNLSIIKGNSVYDDNINASENRFPQEFLMEKNVKKISWRGRDPYGFSLLLNEEIRFKALHFQGASKNLMIDVYKINHGWYKAVKLKYENKIDRLIRKIKKLI